MERVKWLIQSAADMSMWANDSEVVVQGVYRFRDMVLSKEDLLKVISNSRDAEASCSASR